MYDVGILMLTLNVRSKAIRYTKYYFDWKKFFFYTIYLAINKCSMYNNTIFNEHTTKKCS